MDTQNFEQELNKRFKEFFHTSSEFQAYHHAVLKSLEGTDMELVGYYVKDGELEVILDVKNPSNHPSDYVVLGK